MIEVEANGDISHEAMYPAAVRLLLRKETLMQHPMA